MAGTRGSELRGCSLRGAVLAWGEEPVNREDVYPVKIDELDGPLRGRILVDEWPVHTAWSCVVLVCDVPC
jgi:hypothetical protein